jgi:YD repeat-containing protein
MGVYSYNGSDSYIGYDEVDEIEGDGSYTKHFFTSYGTDLNNVSHADQPIPGSIGWAVGDNYFPYISLDRERGKPVAVYSYTPGNVLVKKEITTYRSDAARFNTYIRTVRNTGIYEDADMAEDALIFAAAIPVYSYDYYPVASTVTTYDQQGNNPLVESHAYTYNVNNQVATQTDIDSKGESVVTTYQYPADMTSDATCVAMTAAHILSPVIQKTTVNTTRSSEQLISNHTTYYSPSPGIYAPQSIQFQIGSNPVETRQQFYQYDSYGNVVELSKTSDTHEVYLWGYKGQYPVAKITGSTYSTVMGYITQGQLDNAAGLTDLQMRTALNAIRTGIPTALVTTYTYSPVTGITSETDPRGQTTYYQYDTYQRLHAILDQDQNVLKTYNYNYAQ